MAKLKHLFAVLSFLTVCLYGWSQPYVVSYSSGQAETGRNAGLQTAFASRTEAGAYISRLPSLLQAQGFITASVDSVKLDSAGGKVSLFLGEQYRWKEIRTRPVDAGLLEAIRWPSTSFSGAIDFAMLRGWQQKVLDHLEDNGHPFGKVYLDSVNIEGREVSGLLTIEQGPFYRIDSIRVFGDARVSNEFLQRYLDIYNGSAYSRKKLESISNKLSQLTYVQEEKPSDLTLLASGSMLNLYLKDRKNSQVNALVGFLPNSDQLAGDKKLLLTVDVNILLRNALGSGETMGIVWQQLQQKSPRLNIIFDQPYIFRSPFGLNFSLDMYKRDSTFLNINMNLGTSYRIGDNQTGTLFVQRRQSIVSGINPATVLQTKTLPREADVSSINLGLGYSFNNTDYRFNPRRGNELVVTTSTGTKKIRKNNQVLELKDPSDPSFNFESLYDTVKLKAYQFRVTGSAAHYIPLGVQSTFKLGLNGGIYQSANYFRNELFQIGGFKLLRGFDEESQFVSRYAVGTLEYRIRLQQNSFAFAFADGGYGTHILETKQHHTYIGTGIGLSFETRAGIINIAWAVGKRDDTELNLRQSKLHLGFASYF
ncbi:MAG TPA: BamA/TamA family outer membrane protein [Flavisolibacter sp.]|nr:BamA/TamA family outer membrane protein [Flavisolibacter sp.]